MRSHFDEQSSSVPLEGTQNHRGASRSLDQELQEKGRANLEERKGDVVLPGRALFSRKPPCGLVAWVQAIPPSSRWLQKQTPGCTLP